MNPALLMLLTFLAGVLLVAAVYSFISDIYLRDRNRVSKRLDEEFRKRQRDKARQSRLFKEFSELAAEAGADESEAAPTFASRFAEMVEQSGVNLTVRRLLTLMAAIGLGLGALAGLVRHSLVIAAAATVVGALGPYVYVRLRQKLRVHKLLSQLPDAFDLMARVIRAGQTMSQAMLAVADEFDPPIASEFSYCYEQQNLGLPPELALRDLARRTGMLEIKIFVLALLVQQQTGGNLSEMLEKLATVVRERFRLLAKIRALTAEGRFQAAVLLALPPGMFLMILFLNRSYAQLLIDSPVMLVAIAVAEVVGALWIRKIVNFDF
ncbi:MAG: type II secretion system F family protein [Gemmataceae bacterium]